MSLLINSTTLGNIIITLGSVFLLYYLIRKFAWDQITGIFAAREKKIATDIDSAENARQEAEILVQKRQEELDAADRACCPQADAPLKNPSAPQIPHHRFRRRKTVYSLSLIHI